jgi:hypothetical protein
MRSRRSAWVFAREIAFLEAGIASFYLVSDFINAHSTPSFYAALNLFMLITQPQHSVKKYFPIGALGTSFITVLEILSKLILNGLLNGV